MIAYRPDDGNEAEIVYVCDNCGGLSNFSDYRWPGHVHWQEFNYTLCNDCLRLLAGRGQVMPPLDRGKKSPPL